MRDNNTMAQYHDAESAMVFVVVADEETMLDICEKSGNEIYGIGIWKTQIRSIYIGMRV